MIIETETKNVLRNMRTVFNRNVQADMLLMAPCSHQKRYAKALRKPQTVLLRGKEHWFGNTKVGEAVHGKRKCCKVMESFVKQQLFNET